MSRENKSPHLDNVRGQGDRISSGAEIDLLDAPELDETYIDPFHGHTWSFTPKLGAALYGKTELLPTAPIDHLAKGRFLRVPFRRVPVIDVLSAEELAGFATQFISLDPSIQLRWRGQTRQYLLKRTEDDLLRLYGSTEVDEPSLVPSVVRSGAEFSAIFPAWSAVLDLYLAEKDFGSAAYEVATFRSGYTFRQWAFATAQHYGIPSVGLDVTTDLWTAVLFAIYQFRFDAAIGKTRVARVGTDAEPILYAMGGFQNDLFDDASLAPEVLQCARPKAQAAHFFGTGWGAATNKAAERIFIAFRLLNTPNWNLPKRVEELFPSAVDDPFLAFLEKTRERFPSFAEEAQLHRLYSVET